MFGKSKTPKKQTNAKPNKKLGKNMPNGMVLGIVVFILLVLGTYMVFSASYVGVDSNPPWYYLIRHLIGIAVGSLAGLVFFKLARANGKKWIYVFLAFSFTLLIIAYVFGEAISGSKRWISLGFMNIQPSELLKVALILLVARLLTKKKNAKIWPSMGVSLIIAGFVAYENLSSAALIFAPIIMMFFIYGINKKEGFMILGTGIAGFIFALIAAPYRMLRVTNLFGVWLNPLTADYQAKQSLYALADGGLLGVGITNSKQKFFHLPEHHTDFIFAIVGEELGFIGAVTFILLLLFLSYIIIQIAKETKDKFSKLSIFGFGALFIFQTLLNLAVVTSISPVTGVTLPFISYGGSSLLSFLMIIGFILGVSLPKKRRHNEQKK